MLVAWPAPGQGEIDCNEIRPHIKPDLIKSMEIHPEVEKETLVQGRDIILNVFIKEQTL